MSSRFEKVGKITNSKILNLLGRFSLVTGIALTSNPANANAQEIKTDPTDNDSRTLVEENLTLDRSIDRSTWELEVTPEVTTLLTLLTTEEVLNGYKALNSDDGEGSNDDPDPETPTPPAFTVTVNPGGANLRTNPEITNNIQRVANAGDEFDFIRTISGTNVLGSSIWYELRTESGATLYAHSSTTGEPTPVLNQDEEQPVESTPIETPVPRETPEEQVPVLVRAPNAPTTNNEDSSEVELTPVAPEDEEVETEVKTPEGTTTINQNEVFGPNNEYTGTVWTGENAINIEDLDNFSVVNEGINIGLDFYPTPTGSFKDEIIIMEKDSFFNQIFNGRFGGCIGRRVIKNLEPSLKELIVADCVLFTEIENNIEIAIIFSIPINGMYAGTLSTTSQLATFDEIMSHLYKGNRIIVNGISIDNSNQDLMQEIQNAINNSPDDLANFLTSITLTQSEPTALPIDTQQTENGNAYYIGIPWTISYNTNQ